MTEIIFDKDHIALARKGAAIIQRAANRLLKNKGHIVLGIPGGRSVKDLFLQLPSIELPWNKIHIFWVDDRMVPNDHPDSNCLLGYEYFINNLIDNDKIPIKNIHPLDIKSTIHEYSDELKKLNGFDIIILGVGEDGHVGALYPDHHSIKDETDGFFTMDDSPKPPPERMTGSRKLFEKADTAIALILGEGKKDAYTNYKNSDSNINSCPAKLIDTIKNGYILTDLK